MRTTLALVFALLAASAPAQTSAPASPGISSLDWLAGSWGGPSGSLHMEEHWTTPAGGLLLGMHRDIRGERAVMFEFMRIEERDGVLTFLASPRNAPPTSFPAKEHGPRRIVFENAAHDFPQRIIYWRDGALLRARVEGVVNGKAESEEWAWPRLRNP